jgi:hypothetical protein
MSLEGGAWELRQAWEHAVELLFRDELGIVARIGRVQRLPHTIDKPPGFPVIEEDGLAVQIGVSDNVHDRSSSIANAYNKKGADRSRRSFALGVGPGPRSKPSASS